MAAEGRVLLRLLEQDAGPEVEIAWPDDAGARERLYQMLAGRMGMRSGLLDVTTGIFYDAKGSGPLDLDRYSRFVRYPEGAGIVGEQQALRMVRAQGGAGMAQPVRVFPRAADALLLGGLARLVGKGFGRAQVLRARYRFSPEGVLVGDIVADGRSVPGNIRLIRP